jgi:integrase/recombinase XerD
MHRHDHAVTGLPVGRAAGFAAYLAGRGYAKSSIAHHLYLMADLSAWLAGQGLDAGDLTGPAADRFWEDLRARGSYLMKGTALKPLLDYLRDLGVLPEQAGGPDSAAGALLHEYDRYLRAERGAGEVTVAHYLRYAHEFMAVAGWPQDGPEFGACLAALDSAQVLDIVSRQVARHRLPSVGAALTGDRAFLRFLERTERPARPLAAAVPRAARQPARLPGQVDPATAAAIVASCDRATEGGCRDRAVLLLLHRYGLRPVEVTRLKLPDLRWRAGEFVVHGKGGRVDVLPLVRDAGGAIVEYLQIRRAAPPGVTAVFLSARAPVQPMHNSGSAGWPLVWSSHSPSTAALAGSSGVDRSRRPLPVQRTCDPAGRMRASLRARLRSSETRRQPRVVLRPGNGPGRRVRRQAAQHLNDVPFPPQGLSHCSLRQPVQRAGRRQRARRSDSDEPETRVRQQFGQRRLR